MLGEYIEKVSKMIRDNVNEDDIDSFISDLYVNNKITDRGYIVLSGMNYR
jgi:hypothetical protein